MTTDAQREIEKAAREYVRRQYPFYTDQAAFGAGVTNGEVRAFSAGVAWQASQICDWLAATDYGFDWRCWDGTDPLPPGITVRALAEAYHRRDGEPVDEHIWALEQEGISETAEPRPPVAAPRRKREAPTKPVPRTRPTEVTATEPGRRRRHATHGKNGRDGSETGSRNLRDGLRRNSRGPDRE